MSQVIQFNGQSYTIPNVGDNGWGQQVTNYLTALSTGTLQTIGGNQYLTGTLNLGPNYGLIAVSGVFNQLSTGSLVAAALAGTSVTANAFFGTTAALTGPLVLGEQAGNPSVITNSGQVYVKTDGNLYYEAPNGTVTQLVTPGGAVSGTGTTGQPAVWNSSNSITTNPKLSYSTSTGNLAAGSFSTAGGVTASGNALVLGNANVGSFTDLGPGVFATTLSVGNTATLSGQLNALGSSTMQSASMTGLTVSGNMAVTNSGQLGQLSVTSNATLPQTSYLQNTWAVSTSQTLSPIQMKNGLIVNTGSGVTLTLPARVAGYSVVIVNNSGNTLTISTGGGSTIVMSGAPSLLSSFAMAGYQRGYIWCDGTNWYLAMDYNYVSESTGVALGGGPGNSPTIGGSGVNILTSNTATNTTMMGVQGDISAQGGFRQTVGPATFFSTASTTYTNQNCVVVYANGTAVTTASFAYIPAYSGTIVGIGAVLTLASIGVVTCTVQPTIGGTNSTISLSMPGGTGPYTTTAAKDSSGNTFSAGQTIGVVFSTNSSVQIEGLTVWLVVEC